MQRAILAACVLGIVLLILGGLILRWKGRAKVTSLLPVPPAGWLYSSAPTMPPLITTSIENLLEQYEGFLRSDAPTVLAALQPGLSDADIDRLETQHKLKLPNDLRVLYRWRNGTPRSANIDVFPNHEFVPLDVALSTRDDARNQIQGANDTQQEAHKAFSAHRDPWVGVIVDLSGDGHFFDPERTPEQGSFFYCFAEERDYIFYPAFRNYLAAVIEGQKSGVFVAGQQGIETADYMKAHQLYRRFGAESLR